MIIKPHQQLSKKQNNRNLQPLDQCTETLKIKIQDDITRYLDQESEKYTGDGDNAYMVKYGLLTELLDELKTKIDIGDD